jgi:hypothetical protein
VPATSALLTGSATHDTLSFRNKMRPPETKQGKSMKESGIPRSPRIVHDNVYNINVVSYGRVADHEQDTLAQLALL